MNQMPFELGRYHVLERIGSDELADVFRAELSGEAGFVKTYALKRFNERATALPMFVSGLTQAAVRNTSLEHGGIVKFLGFERIDDAHVLVSEYVDGVGLRQILSQLQLKGDRVPWNVAVHIAIEIGEALDYAHHSGGAGLSAVGVAHGGLSPNNIMLSSEGGVRLLNYGLAATLARAKHMLGERPAEEFAYLAPEQLEGAAPGGRSDQFSLGAILYEMLACMPLYVLDAGNERQMKASPQHHLGEERALLEPLLFRLLAEDPAERFESTGDAVDQLRMLQFDKGQKVSATPFVVWLEEVAREQADDDLGFDDEEETLVASEETLSNLPDLDITPKGPRRPRDAMEFGDNEPTLQRGDASGRIQDRTPTGRDGEVTVRRPGVKESGLVSPSTNRVEVGDENEQTIEKPGSLSQQSQVEFRPLPPEGSAPSAVPGEGGDASASPGAPMAKKRAVATEEIPVMQSGAGATNRPLVVALVFVTVLCVVSLGIAVYLYLQLSRGQGAQAEGKAPTPKAAMTAPVPMGSMRAAPRTRPRPAMTRPRPRTEPRARPMERPKDAMPAPAMDARVAPRPAAPKDLRAVPRKGRAKKGELDVHTAPRGVNVIYKNYILGKTPLRLKGKPGQRYILHLNKKHWRGKTIRKRLSRYVGLKVQTTLKWIRYPSLLGRKGMTRLDIRCKTPNVYRVFLNGRDTGRNCPVTLKVSRGKNAPGIYIPRRDRVVFKKVRSVAKRALVVQFDH